MEITSRVSHNFFPQFSIGPPFLSRDIHKKPRSTHSPKW